MKPKFDRKLTLNKSTVANLSKDHMANVKGGLMWTDPRACDTNYTCTDFTYAACPPEFQSNYQYGCCTVAKCNATGRLCVE
jgi:hypothetical protein